MQHVGAHNNAINRAYITRFQPLSLHQSVLHSAIYFSFSRSFRLFSISAAHHFPPQSLF